MNEISPRKTGNHGNAAQPASVLLIINAVYLTAGVFFSSQIAGFFIKDYFTCLAKIWMLYDFTEPSFGQKRIPVLLFVPLVIGGAFAVQCLLAKLIYLAWRLFAGL